MKTEALGYFCLGAAFGVAASVLFAPKSGPETRAYLASAACDGTDYVKARVDEVRTDSQRRRHCKQVASDSLKP